MAKRLDYETLLERKHENRMRREERTIERLERQERAEARERAAFTELTGLATSL